MGGSEPESALQEVLRAAETLGLPRQLPSTLVQNPWQAFLHVSRPIIPKGGA